MDRTQREIQQFEISLHEFEQCDEKDWTDQDIPLLANKLKTLVSSFQQVAHDYGVETTGHVKAPKHIIEELQNLNTKIQDLKTKAKDALDKRQKECEVSS